MLRHIAPLVILLSLAACKEEPPSDTCGAEDYAGLEGKMLAAVTLPADLGARITGPDRMVTQDYRPDRLNIWVNEAGVIERLYCG